MGNDPANMIDPTGMKAQVGYGQEVNYMHDLYAPKDQGSGGGSGSQRYAEDWDYEMEWNLAMEWKEKQDKDKKGDNEPSTDGGDNGGIDVTGINLLGTLESALSSTPSMSTASDNPMSGPLYASAGDGDGKEKVRYGAGEGSMTPNQFKSTYFGMSENEIMTGRSSFLGVEYPNDMKFKNTRFVQLANGKEVDMIHFMVVGRKGHMLGLGNELHQAVRFKSSAFNPQDLYSNKLGVDFFRQYGNSVKQYPSNISIYISEFLNSSRVLYPPTTPKPPRIFGPK